MSSKQVEKPDTEKDSSHNTQLNGVAGILNQGNWGIAKSLATGILGQVNDDGSEKSITSSFISTKNITITDSDKQQQLTGNTVDETARAITQNNTHQALEKANVAQVKSDLEQDLSIAQDFVDNLNKIGDKLYYEVEKNKNNILIKYKPDACDNPSCLQYFELDMEQLKNKEQLTKAEAEILSRMYVHGIFNTSDQDRTEGGILYGGKDTLNNASLVVRKPYAGIAEELTYTVFERLRAGIDIPSILGASNASRDQVTIWDKLDQYNQQNENKTINLKHLAHSLGASSTKNAMNWSGYKGITFDYTTLEANTAGTSYPITSNTLGAKLTGGLYNQGYTEKASQLFKDGSVTYAVAPRDVVGTGISSPWMPGSWSFGIGNTNTTGNNTTGIPLWGIFTGDHTKAYYRDRDVIEFINSGEKKKNIGDIFKYQQNVWGQIGPQTKTIQFNGKNILENKEDR